MIFLVTGPSGFVGSNLIPFLEWKEHEAEVVSRSDVSGRTAYTWEDDAWEASRAEVWIHLAGKAHDVRDESAAEEYFEINTRLTERFFKGFLSSRSARTFVYFSSVKAAASKINGVLREEDRDTVTEPYGASKRAAEESLLSAERGEKRLFILRPCMIHGPGNKGNLNLLYQVVRRGIPYPLGAFDNQRSLLSIDNLCAVVEAIVQEPVESGVYNVADDEPLSTREMVRLMAEAEGRTPRIWEFPRRLVYGVARIGDIFHLPLTSSRLEKLTESYVVSNEKIKRALGWGHMPVSARDGLVNTIQSFRS